MKQVIYCRVKSCPCKSKTTWFLAKGPHTTFHKAHYLQYNLTADHFPNHNKSFGANFCFWASNHVYFTRVWKTMCGSKQYITFVYSVNVKTFNFFTFHGKIAARLCCEQKQSNCRNKHIKGFACLTRGPFTWSERSNRVTLLKHLNLILLMFLLLHSSRSAKKHTLFKQTCWILQFFFSVYPQKTLKSPVRAPKRPQVTLSVLCGKMNQHGEQRNRRSESKIWRRRKVQQYF